MPLQTTELKKILRLFKKTYALIFFTAETERQLKTPVENFRRPTKSFVRSKDFKEIKKTQLGKTTSVLHISGLPGSGKSEIVRQLAVEFPYAGGESIYVKYQIDCSDNSEDTVEGLKHMLDTMYDNNLLERSSRWKTACSCLERSCTTSYLKLLANSSVPILLIVEDPPEKDRKLLEDLMCVLDDSETLQCQKLLHVYITSKSKEICNSADVRCYLQFQLRGFLIEESFELLEVSKSDSLEKQQAAEEISAIVSGLPLGLIAVKATCKKTGKSLRQYLERYKRCPAATHRLERKTVEELGSKHIFQCMVRLLYSQYTVLWSTMQVLVMFHHGAIPQQLIAKVMQFQRNCQGENLHETLDTNDWESCEFISDVEKFGICSVYENLCSDTAVSFHRVVFVAVRLHLKEEGSVLKSLQEALFAISALVHKDVRKASNFAFMKSMQPHIDRVLRFVDEHPEICDQFLVNMTVAHLQEVLGVIRQPIEPAEESLRKSVDTIWKEAKRFSNLDLVPINNVDWRSESAGKYAKKLAQSLLAAGEKMKDEDIEFEKYISLVMQFAPSEQKFLQDLCSSNELADFLKATPQERFRISPKMLTTFRDLESGTLFLDRDSHCTVFFVERMASALYSLGRVVINTRRVITPNEREKFVWFSDVAHGLCVHCERSSGVRLLFLRRGAVAKVAVRLKSIQALDPETKKDVLLQARREVEELVENKVTRDQPYFENGLRKSVSNAFEDMTYLRYIVRVDTKLFALSSPHEREKRMKNADEFCSHLHEVAVTNDEWQLSPKCVIYCGKYLASKSDYSAAAELFSKALSSQAIQTDKALLFPWACSNYARCVAKGELRDRVSDAIDKCEEALKFREKIVDDLLSKLEDRLETLENLKEPHFPKRVKTVWEVSPNRRVVDAMTPSADK